MLLEPSTFQSFYDSSTAKSITQLTHTKHTYCRSGSILPLFPVGNLRYSSSFSAVESSLTWSKIFITACLESGLKKMHTLASLPGISYHCISVRSTLTTIYNFKNNMLHVQYRQLYLMASSTICLILLVLLSRPLVFSLSKEKFGLFDCLFSIHLDGLLMPSLVASTLSLVLSPGSLSLLLQFRPSSIGVLLQLCLIRSDCPFTAEFPENSDLIIPGTVHLTVALSCGSAPSISPSWIFDDNLIQHPTDPNQPFCHPDQLDNILVLVSKIQRKVQLSTFLNSTFHRIL